MHLLVILVAAAIGCASAVQGATNGALATRVGLVTAVAINALVVFVVAGLLWLSSAKPASAGGSPWYLYAGGLYGLSIIAGAAFAYPRLGAGPTTALMITAQLVTALALDHLGIPGGKVAVTPARLAGVLLLLAGALLVLWPKLSAR